MSNSRKIVSPAWQTRGCSSTANMVSLSPMAAINDADRARSQPRSCSDHLDRSRIGAQALVRGDERHGLGDRLRDEHPVERVGVNGRKAREPHGVLRGYGKLMKSVCLQGIADRRRVGGEVLAAPRGLDRDLPQARRTVEELMAAVAKEAR